MATHLFLQKLCDVIVLPRQCESPTDRVVVVVEVRVVGLQLHQLDLDDPVLLFLRHKAGVRVTGRIVIVVILTCQHITIICHVIVMHFKTQVLPLQNCILPLQPLNPLCTHTPQSNRGQHVFIAKGVRTVRPHSVSLVAKMITGSALPVVALVRHVVIGRSHVTSASAIRVVVVTVAITW